MKLSDINPKDVIFALDIGTRSVIGTLGIVRDKKFNVICEKYMEHEQRAMIDGQIHDVNLVALTVNSLKRSIEEETSIKLKKVALAAAGRFLKTVEVKESISIDEDKEIDKEVIRSLELTTVKKAEEEINKETKGKLYCVGYSVKNYYLNGYVISNLLSQKGDEISASIIATFLPRSVIDSLYSVMKKVDLYIENLTLEPIAAMESAVPKKLRLLNIALVDVGAGTSDIAISSNATISAYGMVPMAGDEVTETIVQNYLVDFDTAESIKKQCTSSEKIKYTDILGIENEVSFNEVIKSINPVVDKVTNEIAAKIIELNGGKSPNAVFLVGGGAHTPNFREYLAKKLKLPEQRIGIKGRDSVAECTGFDEGLGSIGVTVLGIALVAIKKSGNDFIDVFLNDEVISLFTSHKHTVMDVMLQAGINYKSLIGRNGKNMRFVLNDIKRVAFGSLGKGAKIKINNKEATIDTEVREGDNIQIVFAQNGKDASPKVVDYIKKINSTSFYLNDIIQNIEPVAFINDKKVDIEQDIKQDDNVIIIYPSNLGEYIKYKYNKDDKKYSYYLRDKKISMDYIIKEGDRIYTKVEYGKNYKNEDYKILNKENEEEKVQNKKIDNEESDDNEIENKEIEKGKNDGIKVIVNDKPVLLTGKDKYIFIDIFNYIDFDLSYPKGNLVLTLNDEKAGYYNALNPGDIIKIFWDKK